MEANVTSNRSDPYFVVFFEYDRQLQTVACTKAKFTSTNETEVSVNFKTTVLEDDGREVLSEMPYAGKVVFSGSSASCREYHKMVEKELTHVIGSKDIPLGDILNKLSSLALQKRKMGGKRGASSKLKEIIAEENSSTKMRKKNVDESVQGKDLCANRTVSKEKKKGKEKDSLLTALKLKEINAFAGIVGTPQKGVIVEKPENRNLSVEDHSTILVDDTKQEEPASAENARKAGTTPEKNETEKKRHATPEKNEAQKKKPATPSKNETEKKMLATPKRSEARKKKPSTPSKNETEKKKPSTPKKTETEKKKPSTPKKTETEKKRLPTPKKNEALKKKPTTPSKNETKRKPATPSRCDNKRKTSTPLKDENVERRTGITSPNRLYETPKKRASVSDVSSTKSNYGITEMPNVVKSGMLSLLQSDLSDSDVNEYKHTRGDTANSNFGGFEYGYNYHELEQSTDHTHSHNQVPRELTHLIGYFQQLNEEQKRAVTGFMCVLNNTLQACTMQQSIFSPELGSTSSQERFYASPVSPPPQESTFASYLSGTFKPNALPEYEKKVPLIVDKQDDKRFKDILVNPVCLRKAEQCALIHKNPGLYLVNKVASLLFSSDELQTAKGVSGLHSIKQEALLEYLRAKEKSLGIPPVSHNDYRRTLQNKLTNARKDRQKALKMSKHA